VRLPKIDSGFVSPFSILFAGLLAFSLADCDGSTISLEDLEAAAATIEVEQTDDMDQEASERSGAKFQREWKRPQWQNEFQDVVMLTAEHVASQAVGIATTQWRVFSQRHSPCSNRA
jgi:hypothetical protein